MEKISKITSPILAGDFDVALGTKFLGKKWNKDLAGMPLVKLITLKMGIAFTRITTQMQISDTHTGFRAFSPNALKRIRITQNRMAHGSEILKIIAKTKMRYCEIPVKVIYSEYSKEERSIGIKLCEYPLGIVFWEERMKIFQILFGLIMVFPLLYISRTKNLILQRIIYLTVSLVGVFFIFFPEITSRIANILGIGRGADLIFY